VALRIKCKCGKVMKIPSAQAGKSLSCPGCKKVFRISPEKFKQASETLRAAAGQSAVKKQPTRDPPKPAAESATLVPAELDILPVDLNGSADLSMSQSDVLGDKIPIAQPIAASPSGRLGLACPLCLKTLAPGAVLCVDCGFNVATGAYVKTSPPPTAQAVTTAPAASYASDRSWIPHGGSNLAMDAIQAPKRSYWADALYSFGYPFISTNNGVVFGMILFADSIRILLGHVFPFLPCFIGPVFFIAMFAIRGWIAAVKLSVIQDTASGSEDLPGIKIEDGAMEDVIKPLVKYIGAIACAMLPASIYMILLSNGVLPITLSSGLNLVFLVGVGMFLWPIFLMLFAFNAPAQILRLDLIFTTIIRTFLPYLSLWLMLLVASSASILGLMGLLVLKMGMSLNLPQVPQLPGIAGDLLYNAIDFYLSIVSMRLIGLYYLHFKKRFTFVME